MHARLRSLHQTDDSGFALVYVLLVCTVITLAVTMSLVVTGSNVVPAVHATDNAEATGAAEAGLQRYLAFLSANCTTFNTTACSSINGTPVTSTVAGGDGLGSSTFTTTVLNPSTYIADGFLRVRSVGTSNTGTRTLIADMAGSPGLLRYTYFSKYETLSSNFLTNYYGTRTVAMVNDAKGTAAVAAANNATVPVTAGSTVGWTAPSSLTSPYGYDTSVCDKLYYDDASNSGTSGRATIEANSRTSLPTGTDWAETGTNGSLFLPCQIAFTTGQSFNGPVYTRDEPYLSAGVPGGAGPKFTVSAGDLAGGLLALGTSYTPPGGGNVYHSFPIIGGSPNGASTTNGINTYAKKLSLPTSASDALAGATCVYTGPTRITVSGATATIMSPLTAAGSSTCNKNTSSLSGTGVTSAQVPIATTSIYVQNVGSGSSGTYATSANPIFSLSSGTADPSSSATTSTVAGTSNWSSYTPGAACGTVATTDQKSFECALATGATSGATYTWAALQTKASALMTAYTPTSSLTNDLTAVVDNTLGYYNVPWTNAATAPTTGTLNTYRYKITPAASDTTVTPAVGCPVTAGTTTGLTNASLAAPTGDAFLASQGAGTESKTVTCAETTSTATVVRQTYGCYNILLGTYDSATTSAMSCNGLESAKWGSTVNGAGNTTPQFTMTATRYVQNTSYALTAQGVSAFPDSNDITQYPIWNAAKTTAPGDVYIEGTGETGRLSVIAENDIVVTGNLTTTTTLGTSASGEPAWASGGAIDLIADNNVRVYHPMSCADTTVTATTAGWCPNDITGLYSGGLETAGALSAAHPAMQYCNLTAASTGGATGNNAGNSNCASVTATGTGPVSEIDAATFALGGAVQTDNYNRGVGLGSLTVVGGFYQQHRGGIGVQWELQTTDSSRASSGYVVQDTYRDLTAAGLAYVPAIGTSLTARAWNIVSVSVP
jgi:hypothetical protein